MRRVIPSREQFQHFVAEVKESLGGDVYGRTRRFWEKFLEKESLRERDRYLGVEDYERKPERRDYRKGFYRRCFVTVLGSLVLRVARARGKSFLPRGLERFPRRAERVRRRIREAFLRGLSTRPGGRGRLTLTGEPVSAPTVSKRARGLDRVVKAFPPARLQDAGAYLFLEGVRLRVRRPSGRKRVPRLGAYGVRRDGPRRWRAFLRSPGESPAAGEGLRPDLDGRGLQGQPLEWLLTDGGAGWAAAWQTVYPHGPHPRGGVHKRRPILEPGRQRDYAAGKADAQAISRAAGRRAAEQAFRRFRARGQGV